MYRRSTNKELLQCRYGSRDIQSSYCLKALLAFSPHFYYLVQWFKGSKGSLLAMFYCICLANIIFHRNNSTAPTPHCTSQQLNHHHSTNPAIQSKLTLLRRPPAIHSFPPPSRRTQQIQPFPQSCARVSPTNRGHVGNISNHKFAPPNLTDSFIGRFLWGAKTQAQNES